MFIAILTASIVGYAFMAFLTANFIVKIGQKRNWLDADMAWAVFLGFFLWPAAWIAMAGLASGTWLSKKVK